MQIGINCKNLTTDGIIASPSVDVDKWYTSDFKYLHNQKSTGLKSVEYGGLLADSLIHSVLTKGSQQELFYCTGTVCSSAILHEAYYT
ncbi:hypothetical protein TNCV_750281 [Trichonephila clavipes]|nr:hypothetical protein TNCV_750281 [Trichonephila clavipes]